ncbi:MAG: CPBP family intramembrane glutamic endopeptidase [Promethearchaeota archaeon]
MSNDSEERINEDDISIIRVFITKHSLILFFLLSYLLMFLPVVLIFFRFLPLLDSLFFLIAIWSPTISAVFLIGIINGQIGIRKLFNGWFIWKVSLFWYFAAVILILGPFIVALITILLGEEPTGIDPSMTIPTLVLALIVTIHNGPLCEETGWRGFALPKIESRYGALGASVILGILWAFWHLPLYLIEERINFVIFVPLCLAITILMTWAYNNTNGSLFITFLFHFCFNFSAGWITGYLGLMEPMLYYISGGVMISIYVILIILVEKPAKFSRKPASELPFLFDTNLLGSF